MWTILSDVTSAWSWVSSHFGQSNGISDLGYIDQSAEAGFFRSPDSPAGSGCAVSTPGYSDASQSSVARLARLLIGFGTR